MRGVPREGSETILSTSREEGVGGPPSMGPQELAGHLAILAAKVQVLPQRMPGPGASPAVSPNPHTHLLSNATSAIFTEEESEMGCGQ